MCTVEERLVFAVSDGNRADNDAILQHDAKNQEDKVEEKHSEAQHLVHFPFTGCDGDDDEKEHEEEQHDGTEKAVAADSNWSQTVEERVQEPWDGQAGRKKIKDAGFT